MKNQIYGFQFFNNLSLKSRIFLGVCFMLLGIWIQLQELGVYVGLGLIMIGNLFFLIKNYDNRIHYGKFVADTTWAEVEKKKLGEVTQLQKKMNQWDQSFLDITNRRGVYFFLLILLIGPLLIEAVVRPTQNQDIINLSYSFFIIVIPHFFVGTKRISTIVTPYLSQKMGILLKIDEAIRNTKNPLLFSKFFMRLRGQDIKAPDDVKLTLSFKDMPKDFIGAQFQVSINNVQGKLYPYCYAVLVAKKGFGLERIKKDVKISNDNINRFLFWPLKTEVDIISEFIPDQNDVEVLVLRQATTKTSGYHTPEWVIKKIVQQSLMRVNEFRIFLNSQKTQQLHP